MFLQNDSWVQQDRGTSHIPRASIDFVRRLFPGYVIFKLSGPQDRQIFQHATSFIVLTDKYKLRYWVAENKSTTRNR